MLAVMGQSLLKLRFKEEKIRGSFLELTGKLEKIHKVNLIYSKKGKKQAIMPHLSKKQEELFKKLNLTQYFS